MAEESGALWIFLFALKLGLFYSDELMNKLTNLYQQLPSHPPWCFKSLPVERDKVAWSDLTTLQGQGVARYNLSEQLASVLVFNQP